MGGSKSNTFILLPHVNRPTLPNSLIVKVEVSRKAPGKERHKAHKEMTQPFAPSAFLFFAPLRETSTHVNKPDRVYLSFNLKIPKLHYAKTLGKTHSCRDAYFSSTLRRAVCPSSVFVRPC